MKGCTQFSWPFEHYNRILFPIKLSHLFDFPLIGILFVCQEIKYDDVIILGPVGDPTGIKGKLRVFCRVY
jgi:hypothetical protein